MLPICKVFISYYPLKQGLKLDFWEQNVLADKIYILLSIKTRIETYLTMMERVSNILIYILLSIKTRIETVTIRILHFSYFQFISYYPLKQGLKQIKEPNGNVVHNIYILLSIKTRIETNRPWLIAFPVTNLFISYYPLKQGLKPNLGSSVITGDITFISYYPLKQGLKLQLPANSLSNTLYLYPTIH